MKMFNRAARSVCNRATRNVFNLATRNVSNRAARSAFHRAGTGAIVAALALAAAPAFAHPGHGHDGIAAGMLHPLTGIDHLLALLAAGIWSVRQRDAGAAGWLLPAVFLAMMGAGAAAGMAGLHVPGLESGIALTVLVTGVLVAAAVKLPLWAGAALLGGFAILHGTAHGLELPHPVAAAGYLATSALLLAAGRWIGQLRLTVPVDRMAGGAIAAAGLGMLAL